MSCCCRTYKFICYNDVLVDYHKNGYIIFRTAITTFLNFRVNSITSGAVFIKIFRVKSRRPVTIVSTSSSITSVKLTEFEEKFITETRRNSEVQKHSKPYDTRYCKWPPILFLSPRRFGNQRIANCRMLTVLQ